MPLKLLSLGGVAAMLLGTGAAVVICAADDKPAGEKPVAEKAAGEKAAGEKAAGPDLENLKPNAEVKTESGLTIVMTQESKTQTARDGDYVWVHYTGKLSTGEQFDTSAGGKPIRFQIGKPGIIEGWNQGIVGMKVGEKRRLVIPPALGYGAQGHPPAIPPNSTLIFDVELMGIARPG